MKFSLTDYLRKIFSDVRFYDGDKMLNHRIHATGNYDIIRDSKLTQNNKINSAGYIIGSGPALGSSGDGLLDGLKNI